MNFFICKDHRQYSQTLRTLGMGKRDGVWIKSHYDLGPLHAAKTPITVIRVDKALADDDIEAYLNARVNKGQCVINDFITTPPTKRMSRQSREEEVFPLVDLFLEDIGRVCRHHNMSISHEDEHGGFIVETFQQERFDWLNAADVDIEKPKAVEITWTGNNDEN